RIIRIGPHLEAPFFVRPPKERLQVRLLREVRINRRDSAFEHLPRAAVDGDEIPAMDDLLADAELGRVVIDGDGLAPRHAWDPETPRDDGGMNGVTSPRGEYYLRMQDSVVVDEGCIQV